MKFQKNDIVINIQGDEFNFSLKGVTKMIETMKRKRLIKVSTLIFRNNEKEILNDTNMVKTVIDSNNEALVFTRLPIPYNSSQSSFIHIGIYGYRVDVLQK